MQPEKHIVNAIRTYLEAAGAFVFKIHGGPTMMAGLPDLIVCIEGRFVGIEVKTPTGVLSKRQLYVHDVMRRAGAEIIVATSVNDIRHITPHSPKSPVRGRTGPVGSED